jgi:hypothetical protein
LRSPSLGDESGTRCASSHASRARRGRRTLKDTWFLVLVVLVVAAYVAYELRVPLLAKILGRRRAGSSAGSTCAGDR